MSDTIVSLSNNQVKSTRPLLRIEALTPPSQSSVSSTSPDSNSSVSDLSDKEANSSPDINIPKCCLSNGTFVDDFCNTALPQDNIFCSASMNLNQTFIATQVDGSGNCWNENLSLMSNRETGLDEYQTVNKETRDGSGSAVTSPDSAGRESPLSSGETSQGGSTENDCCSLSSGEMLIRSNSHGQDQSLLVVSFLDESFIPLAAGHPESPAESNLLSTTLPDVLEKFTERVTEENTDYSCLGMTFTQADLPTEKSDMATSNSVTLPSENEEGLLMTFLCESSSADCGIEVPFASVDAELVPCLPGVFTPEQGTTLLSTLSATQQTDLDIYTSTPVQPGSLMPSLPSFPESPCTGNAYSPVLHTPQQQVSVTANGLVAGLSSSISKVKEMEINKFPKSNFSSVKSKVVTKNRHRVSVPALVLKPSQANMNNKRIVAQSKAPIKSSPARFRSSAAVLSTTTEMVNDDQRLVNTEAANLGKPIIQSVNGAVDEPGTSSESPHYKHPVANKHASAVQCSDPISEVEQTTSDQVADTAALRPANQTLCFSSMRKKTNPKPTPKKGVLNKFDPRSDSASGKHKPPVLKMRTRCSSDSLSSSSRQSDIHVGLTKGNLSGSSLNKLTTNAQSKISPREVKRISLVAESSKSTKAGVSSDESRSRFWGQPSPRQSRGTPHSQPPAASPRTANMTSRRWQVAQSRDENRTSKAVGTPQSKQKSSMGSQRGPATRETSLGTASTTSIKPQLHGSRPPQTPTRPSIMGPPPTPSRLPRRTLGPSGTLAEASVHTELSKGSGSTHVSGRPPHKPSPFKTVLKARLITTPGKNIGPSLATSCKPAALIGKGSSNSLIGSLKRAASARLLRLTSSEPVDKSKPKATSRQQPPQQQAPQPNQPSGPPDVVPASVTEGEEKDQRLQQLTALLAASNCRFQAVAIVLQQTLSERDEATKQSSDLCQELASLRGELVCSVHSSERLEQEKDELRVALQDALQKLQEKHRDDMVELEQRLQDFYQAEWDKVHLTYQEETDKCKTLMQQQLEELKANHEAMKLELGSSHAEQLQSVKQQYDVSLEELSKVHNQELLSLEKTLKETGAALSGRIEELTVENNALIEKLAVVENRKKQLPETSQMSPQKDSHTLYLEQELESLKVVLDIKNKQLHQQEKKMMEIATLTEKNVKLDESLKKVQQENEDLKARLEKHYTRSRQLSTEQAVLHESLQKESIVNKRLSMENEELIWKLHNGDLSSPRKVSPTSTSQSFNLQSPHSPGALSSPAVSPR
ncbi:mtus1 [Pungitius sinensis]